MVVDRREWLRRPRLYLVGVVIGFAYSVLLLFVAAILSGGGEGSFISFYVFGSPFTATPAYLLFPVPWMIVGGLLAAGHTSAARVWLVIQAVGIPFAIQRELAAEAYADAGRASVVVHASQVEQITLALTAYAVGYACAWWLTWRRRSRIG